MAPPVIAHFDAKTQNKQHMNYDHGKLNTPTDKTKVGAVAGAAAPGAGAEAGIAGTATDPTVTVSTDGLGRDDAAVLAALDAMPDARRDFLGLATLLKEPVRIVYQHTRGRKSMTFLMNLPDDLDLKRICKALRRTLGCNGCVKVPRKKKGISDDKEVIMLQGDQREGVEAFLREEGIVGKGDAIETHGV